jgi:2,3,4,5-tetrahydropyridine-2,6-dicarboxylate N-succinyltransferase
MPTFKENLSTLATVDDVAAITLYCGAEQIGVIENIDGKRGSLQVYANLLGFEDGSIDGVMAEKGLELFAEHTMDAQATPGKHINIDHLLKLRHAPGSAIQAAITYKIPEGLVDKIQELNEVKTAGRLKERKEDALEVFNTVADLLEKGYLRTAQKRAGEWHVNLWVKQAIMFGFPLGDIERMGDSHMDKGTFPLREFTGTEGFRVIPPTAGLRRGSYAGKGTTFMPPGGYANVGSYVGRNSMVESSASSCAQIGRDCHISVGANIGGVLDPLQATPVILGDYVLLGEGSGVTQGTRLGDLVTLAPGVHISRATPVLDYERMVAYTDKGTFELNARRVGGGGPTINMTDADVVMKIYTIGKQLTSKDDSFGPVIPDGALIIPGMTLGSRGTPKPVPTIVKYIASPKDRAYELNEALRS